MDKEIKICPRCEQGYLYHAKPKYFSGEVILCDECYAMWLGDMKIFYGQYGKDFYSRIGQKGGKNGTTGGFAANRELAKIAGQKGGRISRRGPATTKISMTEESEESKIEVRVA